MRPLIRHDAVVANQPAQPALAEAPVSFPRQRARTRAFQCGRPRSFAICGTRVFYIRSSTGLDPAGSLWSVDLSDPNPVEVCVVDVQHLPIDDGAEVPAAERARRERMREVAGGITAFSLDKDGSRIAFSVNGVPYLADTSSRAVRQLPSAGPVVDPRIDPTGSRVAFVVGRSLHLVDIDSASDRELLAPMGEHDGWGLADFIAAEELDRHRGFWWIDGGAALLVEHVDEAGVGVRWIADPAQPEVEPTAHRYPVAGSPNAEVRLWRVQPDGDRQPLPWDTTAYPYLASVHAREGGVTVETLSRDQRRARILALNPGSTALEPVAEHEDEWWLDVVPGSPTRDETGALVEVLPDHSCDTYRLYRQGRAVSPVGLQVHALLEATAERVTVLAGTDPMGLDAYRIDIATGEAHRLTDGSGWTSAVCSGEVLVTITAEAQEPRSIVRASTPTTSIEIQNLAQQPTLDIRPMRSRVGADALPACLLMPSGHTPGTKVPVIMSPYGGPHAQRVINSALAFASDQWFADQGFAVIVADGRGTPGRGPTWERSIAADWSAAVVEDQVQALEAMADANPDLDATRVGIRGWSFGGYLAALAVMERPDVFGAAVAGAPVTDWRLYDTAYTERYLADPATNGDAYERASLLPRAAQLTRPLLLIHGLADDNVLVAHTLQLSSALLAAGKPHSVVPLSGVTHMTPQEVVAENLMKLEVEFFREHLIP